MPLQLTYEKLRRELGNFLEYGRDPTLWVDSGDTLNAYKANDVAYVIENGLRRVYWPMLPLQKYKDAQVTYERYVWSFMEVTTTLAIVNGTTTYDLPSDFTDFVSNGFSHSTGSVARVSDEELTNLPAASGMPQYFSVRAKPTPLGGKTGYEVVLYPTPDASASLTYKYSVTPPDLDDTNPYHLGGAQLSEVVLEACLAEAEKMLDDTEGLHEKRFRELLAAAIEADRKLAKPETTDIWPLENPATGLLVNKAYLKRLIGDAFQYGPHSGVWDNTQAQRVKLALETGLRKFYAPNILPGERYRHDWSFLKPVYSLQLVVGQAIYDLPEDFSMFVGEELIFEQEEAYRASAIKLVSERQVSKELGMTTSAGRPYRAAYRVKTPQEAFGTVYELLLTPRPDQAYVVNFRYSINPGSLSEETALPFGGQANMQTVIEACLAAVEEMRDGAAGLHAVNFLECLRASVSHDRKVNSPASLGALQEFDVGGCDDLRNPRRCSWNVVTYNGNQV